MFKAVACSYKDPLGSCGKHIVVEMSFFVVLENHLLYVLNLIC